MAIFSAQFGADVVESEQPLLDGPPARIACAVDRAQVRTGHGAHSPAAILPDSDAFGQPAAGFSKPGASTGAL